MEEQDYNNRLEELEYEHRVVRVYSKDGELIGFMKKSSFESEPEYEYVEDIEEINIDKLSNNLLKILIKKHNNAIEYIENSSEEFQLEAIDHGKRPKNIEYIKNPSINIQLKAIKSDPYSILNINNPAKEVLDKLQKNDKNVFDIYNDPNKRKIYKELYNDGCEIKKIDNPSEELQLFSVIKSKGESLAHIKNPTIKAQLKAIHYDYTCIEYIENPSYIVKNEVRKQSYDYYKKYIEKEFIKKEKESYEKYAKINHDFEDDSNLELESTTPHLISDVDEAIDEKLKSNLKENQTLKIS